MSSMSAGRKIRTSLFIVFLMVSMTWSAGINEIVSKYEHESELSDNTVFGLNGGCDTITRTAGTPIYVDPINGSATWEGTVNCPKNSLSEAVSAAISGDEIILQSGNYRDNVTVDNLDDLLIRAADGAKVVFDGTRSIAEDFAATWSAADGNGIQEVDLPEAGWQLFYNYDEQVPARWPNAQFSDDTVFNRSYWAEGTLTSNNGAYTKGWLTDAGPEAGVHNGLNETINATGLDPVGAIAILNLGSFRSNSREITGWNSANGTFSYDPSGVSWKNKHHAYFLEGKRELIDIEGEWWFDNDNSRLHYKTPGGQDANNLDLRVKVQPFAISVDNSDRVTIQGIDFFGTTVNFNNCDRCSFTNSTLEYPSTSKRGLDIAGESEDDRWMTRFYRCTNTFVDQISITNTDGGALEFHGSGGQSNNNTVNNSYFYAIDWTAADQKGLMTTIYEGGRDMYFTNNSVHLTGASSVLSIGDAPKVFYNDVWNVGHLQSDGAVVQVMQGEAPGAEIAYNWIHDIIKYGARFDAPIGEAGEGRNGTMHHNVIWNAAGGLMVKGDYHDIHNNTVFNSTGKNDIIFLTDGGINNKNSTLHRNAVDSVADHRSDDVHANPLPDGTHWNNWNGYTEGYRQSIASGYGNSNCIISDSQSLYCWGENVYGNLGNGLHGSGVYSDQPVEITSFGTGLYPVEVATSAYHSCAILNDGTVSCWGSNNFGQLGDGTQVAKYVPTPTASLGSGVKAVDLALGGFHTCVLLDDGDVKCWGRNDNGQLGDNSQVAKYVPTSSTGFTGASKAIAIAAGYEYTCAIIIDGSVKCWGRNNLGQLGYGTHGQYSWSQNPSSISAFPTGLYAVDLDAGYAQTCAVLNDGRIMCWGQGSDGRLGTGNTALQNSPTFTASLGVDRYAKQVVQGGGHGCAIIDDGTVSCWGAGGPTGTGTTNDVLIPTTTDSLGVGRTAQALIAGSGHTCAILDDGTMACWGFGANGKLGNGATSNELSPVPVITSGVPQNWQVSDFLVDPDNRDFRPKWGSQLHVLGSGAYDADDSSPWTAGTTWTYTALSNPTVGCMDTGALNYDSNAEFEDGSCYYITIAPSATSAQLSATTPMTPITITATTSYVTNISSQPFDYGSNNVHQDSDIAIDRNGNSHICFRTSYGTGNLYYLTDVTGSWAWESVHVTNSANLGTECNIAIDSNDVIHIVYHQVNNMNIKYATRAISTDGSVSGDSTWTKSNAVTLAQVGSYISMDIAEDDTLYMAYFQGPPEGQDLLWSKKTPGGSWVNKGAIDTSGNTGRYNSIVYDELNSAVHVSYKRGDTNNLKHAVNEGSNTWVKQNVDTSQSTNGDTSIAIDSNGYVHIAYSNNGGTKVLYSTNAAGSGFVTTVVDQGANANLGLVMRLDDNDKAHIAYHNANGDTLNYSSNVQGSWISQILDGTSTNVGHGVEMELDTNGDLFLTYLNMDNNQRMVGKFRSLANTETYEIYPDLPAGLSFGANNGTIWGTPAAGFPATDYTIYANTTTQSATTSVQLMSMWQVEPSVAGVEMMKDDTLTPITFNWTGWSSSLVNSSDAVYTAGDAGNYNSIVTDSNGKVHIVSFRDDSKQDLMYTTNESGSWISIKLDSNNNVGKYCSIAIDSADGLHVSYRHETGNKLKYAYKANGATSWSKEDVDSTGGLYTSIAIDSNDKPHIAYRDSGGTLGYAEKTGSSWSWSSIVSGVNVGWTSIAMDSNDDIHIAFYDETGDDLYYVTDTSGSFVDSNLMDISNAGGMALDIAVSPITDEPGISYLNAHSDDLEYKVYDGSSWSTEVVHSSGSVGRYNSIAYDSQGSAHISYEMNGAAFDDLWYASDATGSWVTKGIYVHPSHRTGLYTAIAVDINDDIHIVNHNTVNDGDLYYETIQGYVAGSSTRSALSGVTCTFSPSLPTGLNVEAGTCTISGTPTMPQVNTTHTITATSSTGLTYTGEFYLNVMDQTPVISYSGTPFILTKDAAISTISPTNTGGAATSWSISPAEPTGLTFDTSTGELTGTPTILQISPATYTITATNTGGTDTTTISLSIVDEVPGISYSTTVFDLIVGEAMDSITPSNSGGAATSWSISPGVPTGLNFDTATGELSGTPTVVSSSQPYTVTATNSGGADTATLTIEVQVFATLTSSVDGISDVPNSAITPITFSHTINGDTSSPAWTTGVSASSSQVIDGSFTQGNDIAQGPNGAMAIVGYEAISDDMKLAYYYDGSWTTSVIQNSVTDLKYPSVGIDSNGVVHIVYLDVVNDVLRYATNYSGTWQVIDLHATLGNDANVDKGWIASTDLAVDSTDNLHIVYSTKNSANTKHTINYTTNQGGSWSSIMISDVTKNAFDPAIALDSNDKVHISYFRETGNNLVYATNEGGSWTREEVAITLNQGKYSSITVDYNDVVHISFIKADGNNDVKLASGNSGSWAVSQIQGNPGNTGSLPKNGAYYTSIAADSNGDLHIVYGKFNFADNYILEYMTNSSGSWNKVSLSVDGGTFCSISIDSNDDIHIVHSDVAVNAELEYATASGSGKGVKQHTTWQISPALPAGLHMNWRNGTISGTPTSSYSNTSHTVYANISGNSVSTTIYLEFQIEAPDISYVQNDLTLTKGTAMGAVSSTNSGGAVTSWSISPSFSNGLNFDTSTGEITGTPNTLQIRTEYTITATNSGGTSTAYVNITINDVTPGISYSPDQFDLTKDTPMVAVTPTNSGGPIITWWISPSLSAGLNFDTSTGEISGAPTALRPTTMYTITATNSGGSSVDYVNITVTDSAPSISYSPNVFDLTINAAMSPTATPSNSGGAIPTNVIDNVASSWNSIAIDSVGNRHVVYASNDDLFYATDESGSWVITTIQSTPDVGRFADIAIDSTDSIHISYFDETNGDLKYATDKSGSWVISTIDNTAGRIVGHFTSIAVDSNDKIHISYHDDTMEDLKYATDKTGAWVTSTIFWTGDTGLQTEIVIDSNDKVHIAYYDNNFRSLNRITDESGSWQNTIVDNIGGSSYTTGGQPSIAFDSTGAIHIVHRDVTNSALRYATCSSNCVNAASWALSNIDYANDVGTNSALVIDSNDNLHVTYRDVTNSALRYATDKSGSWVATELDGDGNVGAHSYMAVDSSDNVHVSYSDYTLHAARIITIGADGLYGYSVSPDLPIGLTINPITGEISGTPTVLSASTVYTITAINSGGTTTTTITLAVNDAAPSISYTLHEIVGTLGVSISPQSNPSISGGVVVTWEISPDPGLHFHFNTANGVISGTPSALLTRSQFTIYANNSGGTSIAYVNVTINDVAPGTFSYSPIDMDLTLNQAMTPNTVSPGGGTVTSWEISPDVPTGLNFGSSNGTIWGTPTALQTNPITYTIWANNSGGSTSTTVTITITDIIPSISYSLNDIIETLGVPINPHSNPTNSGGTVTSWEISPDPGPHFHFNTANGVISGTPGALLTRTQYTVYANNSGGTSIAYVNVTINDAVPGSFSYNPVDMDLTLNQGMTPNTVSPGGGAVTSWEISPDVPSGLNFGSSNGTIWGTPTVLQTSAVTYTIWANNSGGSTSTTVTITINDEIPSFSYSPNEFIFTKDVTISPTISPINTGGTPTSYTISPNLFDIFHFNVNSGMIGGTPSTLLTRTQFTITATNSGGSSVAYINVTINDAAPSGLVYNVENMSLVKNQAMTPNTATVNGVITSWEISPDLPTGLSFGSSNGTIWGTPTVVQLTPIIYTVWANNTGGSESVTLNITIADDLAVFSYPNSPYTIVRGYNMGDITPTVTSGTVVSWGIHPSLPSGLSFTSGVISGKPFANQSTVTYTVYANNSGGSATATLQLTINEPTPNIDYNPDNYTLTNNTAIRIDPILQANPPSAVAAITHSGTAAPNACLIQMGDLILYQGTDSTHGRELWAFNHTLPVSVNNPYMVKDVYSGANDGISGDCEDMLVVNNTLFFRGNDGSNGVELWKSDGTSSGTVMVKDLNSGSGSSNPSDFTSANDKLFFTTGLGSNQYRRWVSDGTNVGTYDVGSWYSNFNAIFYPEIEYNGSIYGQGWDGHRVLFSLNETTYERVADLGGGHNNPRALTIYDGWLYFLTYETASGTGCLYRTNGTEAGTSMFICGTPQHQPSGANGMNEFEMQVFNDELYFIRDSSGHGDELWKTDGTQSGTVMVKDIVPGTPSGFCSNPLSNCQGGSRLYATENYLLFDVDSDGDGQLELWKTDGTSGGTSLLKEIFLPGADQIYYHQVDEILYFRASQHGSNDFELWSTDGTPAGTVRVEDIWEGSSGSSPRDIIDVDGTLYFIAYNGSSYSLFNVNNAGNGIIGAPTTWSISPSNLPSGLTFSNGVISGTPTTLQLTPTMYTITATNANGSSSTTINLTIIDTPPGTITYSPHDMVLTKNEWITPNIPTISGDITSWELYPNNLPHGLNFGANNGTIWGAPAILVISPVTYTVWANNSGGSSSTSVNITVNEKAPFIYYTPDDFTFTINETITPTIIPAWGLGGPITTWTINASLPSGIFFGVNNGSIYGSANELWPQHTYIITGINSGGTSTEYINITVIDVLPTSITYPLNNLNLTNNSVSSDLPMSPQITGAGEIVSWEIDGALPQGLSLNGITGEISGIPTELWPTTNYTIWANNSGGPIEIEINITVVDRLPSSIDYIPNDLLLTNNSTSVDLPLVPHITGPGAITSWAINATMPDGLHFGNDNGTIWGTPTELLPSKAYKIWANNTGGSIEVYLNITVVDQVPLLEYSPDSIDLTNNTASIYLPLTPVVTGSGIITSWEINATLPSGILFGTNNGTFYGIPTEIWPSESYTVWANNTGGSASAILNITVVDQLPTSIIYPVNNLNLTNNTVSSELPLTPHITGPGVILSWEISGALPHGLTFDNTNGVISGIPTEVWANTGYTVWANNSGGSVDIELNITVVDEVPTLSYVPDDLHLVNNTAHSNLPLLPQLSGPGEIITWEIDATLPNGLNFGSNNGTFWGIPTELWSTTQYTIWANNSGGSTSASLNVTVVDQIPILSYSSYDVELRNNTQSNILPLTPILSGPGIITSWEINAILPSGISFGSDNGTFYGTPTELWPSTDYTVWANNSGGSESVLVTITVIDQIPTGISYSTDNLILTNNTASSYLPLTPQIIGPGEIISWEISVALPQGLNFDNNNGAISGIPTELWPKTNYTVWANNSGGSVIIEFNITVVDQLPTTFTYNPSDLFLFNNTESSDLPLQPQLTGPGEITSWSINETLPLGLNFGNNNGTIWGIPTELQLTPKPFNITATNSGGSIYVIINITIVEASPTLDYNPDDYNFTRNVIISDIVPTYSPINLIDTWEISPDLPLGLAFDNGTISGTPTVNMTRTEFTVWANNSGGSSSAKLNITIVEPTGSFAYVPAYYNLTRGLGFSPILPNYNGGAIENWSIYPELPTGLLFENGTISGTPTVNSTEVNYTVFANNSGGSVTAIISITINEPISSINYLPDERNETRTFSMTPWFPQVTGGMVETWEISPDLPLGLTFVDGVISGTPTINSTRTNYTVWANNSGGSASTMINLTVVEPVVQLSYTSYELTLVRNVTMAPLMPQLSGGNAETWEISPDLPNGINFTDGMIWGTPLVNSTRTMYTIWANNTGGSTNISLNITVLEPSANIVYDPVNLILTRGETMDPAVPEVDGGSIETWAIIPELPDGLSFVNGVISGTPTVNMTTTNFIIYGNNSGGSSVVGLSIKILEPAPTITYQTDSLVLIRGEAMPSALEAIFGGGAVASFSVDPQLPEGLNFTNGTIFGTPTVNSTIVQYNITAINNGGSDYFLLNITILEPVAILAAESTEFELTRNEDYMNLTLNNTGGMVATWEISPQLPSGLIFGNGTITGTPTVNASLATYTIWANNTGGSDSIFVSIKILEPVANISYKESVFTLINGQDSLFISPDVLGGNPETWEFEPELPDGIIFRNGVFSGIPQSNLTTTTFTIWANNSGGVSSATIELTIDQPFYVVRYPVTILVLNASENMPIVEPIYYFDEDQEPVWEITPELPPGLAFTDGVISGIPMDSQELTSYTVTVSGEMVPITFILMIEILERYVEPSIEPLNNSNNSITEIPTALEPIPDEEPENIAYWLCPIFLILCLWLFAMVYNLRNKDDDVELTSDSD